MKEISEYLRHNKIIEEFEPDVLICSPLDRAKATCDGILTTSEIPTIYRNELVEPTWYETIFRRSFESRISSFENWVQSTAYRRIVIVGHSQYFKSMIRSKEYMRNCDIWQASLQFDPKMRKFSWENHEIKYRCPSAHPHPLNRFFDEDFHLDDKDARKTIQ